MPQAQRTVTVNRPVDEVFAFFTDHGNDPRWRPFVKEMDAVRVTEVGTTVHQVVKGPGGRGIRSDLRITAYDPSSRYAFAVTAGPVRPLGEYLFVPTPGGTEVSMSLKADLHGVKRLLLARSVQQSMDSEAAALDRAKAVIEGT